jgi:ATP-dependent DNA helicase DinG
MALPGDDPAYSDGVLEQIEALVTASQGGAFLLFTSHRALTMAHERLQEISLPFPLFRQGEMPNARLVDAYREAGNGVLLGTFSFWEGVDVPGDVLRLVVIDRIPFAMPDSPLHRARVDKITAAGGDWFGEYALPQAEIRLKQGFGRLIRSSADRGVVAILDARLYRKNYGARILASLPPAPRTSNIDVVRDFYAGPVHAPPATETGAALAE